MALFGIPYPVNEDRLQAGDLRRAGLCLAAIGAFAALAGAGEELAARSGLPFSGALLGTLMLLAWLVVRPSHAGPLRPAADRLLAAMPLLFLPLLIEAVGPLLQLGPTLLPLAATVLASTVAALVATVAAVRVTAWLCSR